MPNKLKQFSSWFIRWLRDNLLWEAFAVLVGIIYATLGESNLLGLTDSMNVWIALVFRFFVGVVGALILVGLFKLIQRMLIANGWCWKLTPRDFGLDSQGSRRIGFAIEKPRRKFFATLEMFWFSGRNNPDEMQLRSHLQLSSHRLRETPDGQFMLAIAWKHMPYGYSLILEDGYYGSYVLGGYYKARIAIRDHNGNVKKSFDVLIRYQGYDALRVLEFDDIKLTDALEHIPLQDRTDDETSRDWSTVPDFQPNLMYRQDT